MHEINWSVRNCKYHVSGTFISFRGENTDKVSGTKDRQALFGNMAIFNSIVPKDLIRSVLEYEYNMQPFIQDSLDVTLLSKRYM